MKNISKEYKVNKIAAALVPEIGQFKVIVNNSDSLVEKIHLIENSLKSDSMEESIRKNIESEHAMLAQALKWMSIKW